MKEDLSDDEYLKKYLLEATMKSVLDKMVIMKTIIHSSEIKIFMLDELMMQSRLFERVTYSCVSKAPAR